MDSTEPKGLCGNINLNEYWFKMADNENYRPVDEVGQGFLHEKYGSLKKKTGTAKKLAVAGGFLGVGYMIYPHPYIAAVQIIFSILKGILE